MDAWQENKRRHLLLSARLGDSASDDVGNDVSWLQDSEQ